MLRVGLFELNVPGQSAANVPSFVGLRCFTTTMLGNGMAFSPSLQATYRPRVRALPPAVRRHGLAARRDLPRRRCPPGAAQTEGGGEFAMGPPTTIFANFDGEFSGMNQFYGGKGGLKVLFLDGSSRGACQAQSHAEQTAAFSRRLSVQQP